MVPRAVQDAGYTAVGLGVLALQQVQTGRREISRKLKSVSAPVINQIERLPRLPVPGVGQLVEEGKGRLVQALR
jgi:hypothetical protein